MVMKKGIILTNIKVSDRVTDWYFSMIYLGLLMCVDWNWCGLDCMVLVCNDTQSLKKEYSAAFASESDIGQLTMSLMAT